MSWPILGPILRGSLLEGETGPVVLYTGKNNEQGDLILRTPRDMEIPLFARSVKEQLEEYRIRNGLFPKSVVSTEGDVYYIGSSFDEAYALSQGNKKEIPRNIPRRMAGRIALVTGSAQGLGMEIAHHLIEEGAFVFLADINIQKVKDLSLLWNERWGFTVCKALGVDVTKEDSIREMSSLVIANTGGLDLFISNAGVLKAGSVKEMSEEDFNHVTRVNYTAYFLGVKHISPIMALQNYPTGRYITDIIQINSKSGLLGSNKNSAYAGGKFGGLGLTQSFALELLEDNIKVNSICPGNYFEGPLWSDPEKGLFIQYLRTGKVPGAKTLEDVKRFYEAKVPMGRGCTGLDVAMAVYYAVEQKYETGQAIPVTGGQIMLK